MKIQEHRESLRCSLLSKRWHCKAKAGQSSTYKVWFISYEDDHITEKPQSDNKTARKSTDPAYMNKLEQQLRVTSAYKPIHCRVGRVAAPGGSKPRSCY